MRKAFLISLLCCAAVPAREPVFRFDRARVDDIFTVTNGTISRKGRSFIWTIPRGQTSTLALAQSSSVIQRLRYYDRLLFEYRILSGRIQFLFNVNAFGIRSGPRQGKQYQWHIGIPTTPRDKWRRVQVVLDIPAWLPWNKPDGMPHETMLNLEVGAGPENLVLEFRDMRLVPDLVFMKPWWLPPVSFPQWKDDRYEIDYEVVNLGPGKRNVRAEVLFQHPGFEVNVNPEKVEILPFRRRQFTLTAKLKRSELPELYEEDLVVAFVPEDRPGSAYLALGWLVKPLAKNHRRQVVFSDEELDLLKKMIARPEVKKWFRLDQRRKNAGWFLGVKLAGIPGTRAWRHGGYRGDLCPVNGCGGKMVCRNVMPEVECLKCGRIEVGTPKAAVVWKLWMGSNTSGYGGLDDIGATYLITRDEKYARKAIELFMLYADNYKELPWTRMLNEVPYYRGNYILGASRIAHGSTYGTNFLLKGHLRLLNMIAESPSWTKEQRQKVYEGFVIPAFAEIAKFPGGLFNMTDITNYDIILAGLAFSDANMLYRGLLYDSGLFKRLTDIKPDGFSSEGRPLNYHYAAMREYVTALPLIKNSGLKLDAPIDLLKAAVRMPYERATLSGFVPASGDSGSGSGVRPSPICDVVYDLFPSEDWLYEAGTRSTLRTFLKSLQSGPPDRNAWRKLLKTTPTLFPDAGFAILRSGDSKDKQVHVTLDYGENPMHAALDRLQVTLWAYGRLFTHGPGSSYNAATNFKRGPEKALAFIGHGSLSNNVVMVDTSDQAPAIGTLMAWIPRGTSGAGAWQAVAAKVQGHYPGVTHSRALVLVRNAVVVLDQVSSDKNHVYDFVYHNFGKLTPGPDWTASPAAGPLGEKANYQNIRELKRLRGKGDLRLKWRLGENVVMDFWQADSGAQAFIGLTGLNNPETRIVGDDAPTVFVRAKGKIHRFATVLQPLKGESNVRAMRGFKTRKQFGVVMDFKDGAHVRVMFRPAGRGKKIIFIE